MGCDGERGGSLGVIYGRWVRSAYPRRHSHPDCRSCRLPLSLASHLDCRAASGAAKTVGAEQKSLDSGQKFTRQQYPERVRLEKPEPSEPKKWGGMFGLWFGPISLTA